MASKVVKKSRQNPILIRVKCKWHKCILSPLPLHPAIKTGHFLSDEQGLKITDPRHEMGLWVFQVIESNLDYWEQLSVISGLKSRSTTLKFMRSSKLLNSRSNDLFCFSSRARFLLLFLSVDLDDGNQFQNWSSPFRTTAENRISNVRTLTKNRPPWGVNMKKMSLSLF